uniref:Uncharacterized protein n=1 Tax=Helianthus annuus TaxID=4232 RepID=A0A251RSP4_HELAN
MQYQMSLRQLASTHKLQSLFPPFLPLPSAAYHDHRITFSCFRLCSLANFVSATVMTANRSSYAHNLTL